MAYYIPTLRHLGEMKARDIPSYLITHASPKNFTLFLRDVKVWYWEKYIQRNSGFFLFHLMASCSLVQLLSVTPYHMKKHAEHWNRL